jgi:hypothetical protein
MMYIYGFLFLLCVFMDYVYKMYLHVFDHDLFMCEQDANLKYY